LKPALYGTGLAAVAALLAAVLLLPYRAEPFPRADGVVVAVPALDRLGHTSDTWDYLQLGRSLRQGKGFTSRFTYAPFLPESAPAGRDVRFPLLWRQPGFPLLVAAAFGVWGSADPDALLVLQGLAIVLLPLAVFLLARTVLTPGWAALAGLWSLLSPVALGVSGPPIATTWFVVLFTLLAAAVLTAKSPVAWAAAGIGLGLVVMLRLETWVLVPGLLLMLVRARERSLGARMVGTTLMVGAAILITIPWHVRLAHVTGNPFYNVSSLLYHDVGPFPGWAASRTLAVRELEPWSFLVSHAGEIARKTLLDLARYGRDLVLLPSPLLPPLAVLALLRPPREPRARALVQGGATMLVLLVLFLAPLQYSGRFLAVLVPFLAIAAVLTLSRFPRYRRVLAGLATLVGLVMLLMARPGAVGHPGPSRVAAVDLNRLLTRAEAAPLAEGVVAITDAPTIYAWIWDRPAVWAPVPEDLPRVREWLPGSMALLTCVRQPNDPLEADLAETYAALGGERIPGEGCPELILWPSASPSGAP